MEVILMIMTCAFVLIAWAILGVAVVLAIRDEKKFAAECDIPIHRHWYDFKEYVSDHGLLLLLSAGALGAALFSLASGFLIGV